MDAVSTYLEEIEKYHKGGRATEHTYRPALKTLIESFQKGIDATNEPQREACGAPDYIVVKGQTPLGYIEAKDVGKNLDKIEKSDQLKRYLKGLNNLILTDYLEFRWYEGGEYRLTARLAAIGRGKRLVVDPDGIEGFNSLIKLFLETQKPTIGSPKELAARMASLAGIIKDVTLTTYTKEDKPGTLHALLEGFKKVLLHDLSPKQFADMYAQTVSYGLFAARCNHTGNSPFTRQKAAYELPKTNPFLRKLFGQMAGPEMEERVAWAVDDLVELLNHADIAGILANFGKRTRREDPVVHFYETFLSAYDPSLRETRGVYYTPEPVVSYIVRSVDHILKTDFGIKKGLADQTKIPLYETVKDEKGKDKKVKKGESHKVLILDPATGTGTFLHNIVDHIYESFSNNKGMWSSYVSEHLLPRLFGFELLMAPYTVAHMKLGLQLGQSGYKFKEKERLNIFLTNSLEETHHAGLQPFAQHIADEANEAHRVKRRLPVMVVLGNPPYSGHSANKSEWIHHLMRGQDSATEKSTENYFMVDGQPLGERNPKWLNDDYVKFIRFAQHRIELT